MLVKTIEDFDAVGNNKVIGRPASMKKSYVNFIGENNILFIDENVRLDNTVLRFLGTNSIIFLCSNRHVTKVRLDIYNNSVFYLGRDANTVQPLNVIHSEGKHILIGDDCLFSKDIWFRNGDPHLIYDCDSMERINLSQSIYLGDHVWIAQNVFLSKGTKIGSGTLVGGWSMTGGKKMKSNSVYGGCPVNLVKTNVFWDKPSVHTYTKTETEASMHYDSKEYIYTMDGNQYPFERIEEELDAIEKADDRLEYIKKNIYSNRDQNRFCIMETEKKQQEPTIKQKMKSFWG